ncbi:MAG: hypothetical protein H6555_09235 [Lewinellaceae bacterium]|nr:hypothetical protein [Lewinellaceae bacterium]
MKYAFLFCLSLGFSTQMLTAQSTTCSPFYNMKEGSVMGYTFYDGKGKVEASSKSEVKSVTPTDKGIEAVIASELANKKGETASSGTFKVRCEGESFYMDITGMIPTDMSQMFGESEMKVTGDGFTIPNNLTVGQKLPDSQNEIQFNTDGPIRMTLKMDISEYQVEAKEKITTPAGTFDCFRVSYYMDTQMSIVKKQVKTVNWIARDLGTVRSENYDKKGNLDSRMELTSLKL